MSIQPDAEDHERPIPFYTALAPANSTYAAFFDGKLVRVHEPDVPIPPLVELIHNSFRALILNPRFSCVMANVVARSGCYRIGVYGEMASLEATASLAWNLFSFVQEQDRLKEHFTTFAAIFTGPTIANEEDFERLLWAQLQRLHDQDRLYHSWDPVVSSNPEDADFAFSFAQRAFFVVGLHAGSSRWTRRFAWPALVFNAHYQFDRLREQGCYQRIQARIRARDHALQGSINPMLSDFGERSEAPQYSGRQVGPDWRCPFHTHIGEERRSLD